MNKPESLIVEEASIDLQKSINEISKKYNLSFFELRIILNDFYQLVVEEERKQKQMYLELQEQQAKKESEDKKCKKN